MSNNSGILGLALMMASIDPIHSRVPYSPSRSKNSTQSSKRREIDTVERNKRRGLKEFKYGEESVWAINKKVADKKAKKRNSQ